MSKSKTSKTISTRISLETYWKLVGYVHVKKTTTNKLLKGLVERFLRRLEEKGKLPPTSPKHPSLQSKPSLYWGNHL